MTKLIPCLTLGLAMAGPAIAVAAPAVEQSATVGASPSSDGPGRLLVVRVEMEGGEAVAASLHEDLWVVLDEAGVEPELPEDAPLELVISPDTEALGAYQVAFLHRGELLDAWSCACSGDELRSRLKHATLQAWKAAATPPAPAPVVAAPEPAPMPAADPAPPPRRARRGDGSAMSLTGMSMTLGGTVMVGVMSVVLLINRADGSEVLPGPMAVWSVGMVSLTTGAVLWGVGRHRKKQARLGLRAAGGRTGMIVTVGGRF